MSIYMGFRLKNNSVHWHFKDSVQTRFGNPNMWYMNIFSQEENKSISFWDLILLWGQTFNDLLCFWTEKVHRHGFRIQMNRQKRYRIS